MHPGANLKIGDYIGSWLNARVR